MRLPESSRSFGYGLRVIRDGCLGLRIRRPGDAELSYEMRLRAPAITTATATSDCLSPAVIRTWRSMTLRSGISARRRPCPCHGDRKAAHDTDRRITKVRKAAATFSQAEPHRQFTICQGELYIHGMLCPDHGNSRRSGRGPGRI